ncbi:MAG: type 4a pilus biogenesis protein PilO, partial [Planctomycetes bacterium]|nr:type 4a pilus biogenesis protein PilO [Planctomycetota bacterium]
MEEHQKLILSIVAVLAIVGAIGVFFYLDWKNLSEANAELEAKQNEEKQLRRRIDSEIPDLKRRLAEKELKVADYEKTLPSAKEIEAMDETLNAYKLQAGVKLLERRPVRDPGARPGVKAQPPLYYKYSYQLSMLADFFAWGEFLVLLENHDRFIRVDEFTAKVEDEETQLLSITMKISTFSYAKVEQPTTAVGATATAPAGVPQ